MSKKFLRGLTRAELRLARPNSYYHVYTHAVEGLNPFQTDELKAAWTQTLQRRLPGAPETRFGPEVFHGIEVVATATMSNHPHLVIRQADDPGELSRFVGNCLRAFALRYNHLTGHRGQVFVRPFEADFLATSSDVQKAIMYVHRNPRDPERILRNTSHGTYVGQDASSWVKVQQGLHLFGGRDAYADRFANYCQMRDLEEGSR